MALQKSMITDEGFTSSETYIKIAQVAINNKTELQLVVTFAKDSESKPFKNTMYQGSYDINGENPLAQGYTYLKTLDEFTDVIDC